MSKELVIRTKNRQEVFLDTENSHAATHIKSAPQLLPLVSEWLEHETIEDDNIYMDKDMGRVVGVSDVVATSDKDDVFYAKRRNRKTYTSFVRGRKPEETSYVTVALHKKSKNTYELWSCWMGRMAPQFPGGGYETPESKEFWNTHALVFGKEEIQPGTETRICPW